MKIIDPGHKYALHCLDELHGLEFLLTFVKREGDKYPGNEGHYPGVNMQEVLRALIDRIEYLNEQIHDDRNLKILDNLRESLYLLEERAADRHGRQFFRVMESDIESYPFCKKCGHIGCKGECHN